MNENLIQLKKLKSSTNTLIVKMYLATIQKEDQQQCLKKIAMNQFAIDILMELSHAWMIFCFSVFIEFEFFTHIFCLSVMYFAFLMIHTPKKLNYQFLSYSFRLAYPIVLFVLGIIHTLDE